MPDGVTPPAGAPDQGQPGGGDFRASLGDMGKDAAFDGVKSAGELANKYLEVSKAVNSSKAPEAPDKYTLPEGFKADDSFVTGARKAAHAAGLNDKQFHAMMAFSVERNNAVNEEVAKAIQAEFDAVKSDKDLGGADFNTNMDRANKVLARFWPEAKAENLALENHPRLLKFIMRMGKVISDDSLNAGDNNPTGGQGGGGDDEGAAARKIYGS